MNTQKKIRERKTLGGRLFFKRIHRYAFPVLVLNLIITIVLTVSVYEMVELQEQKLFLSNAHEIKQQITARLESHALMLRAGVAWLVLSDSITRDEWKEYIVNARIDRYMPDVEGMGYIKIIPPGSLENHTAEIRGEGFSQYSISPSYERDMYTSVVYIEPFAGVNLSSFGYDMFTEPVRRMAMVYSRDFDVACLSGRIDLNAGIGGEELYGLLMFVPYYENGLRIHTVEQRRVAIRGWLYCPYRLNSLMKGVLEYSVPDNSIRVQIFDERLSGSSILFDSHGIGSEVERGFGVDVISLPVEFNINQWQLHLMRPGPFPTRALITFLTGILFSLLLYILFTVFSKIAYRSKQIRNKNKKLKTLNATKDKFFSIIAHDLKSPYNAVLGFSDILLKQVDEMDRQEIKKFAGIIRHSANVAVDLLMNLMVWSQSQTGKLKYSPEMFDIVKLVQEMELLFMDVARQKNIELKRNFPDQAVVFADYAMVGTILRNLVSNAIKFTQSGGRVTISAEKKRTELVVSVTDTGVGISEENREKLFRIDESYSTSGTRNEKGTGLGLILCREFVEKHGGRIWVESKTAPSPESGSTFSFTLPSPH